MYARKRVFRAAVRVRLKLPLRVVVACSCVSFPPAPTATGLSFILNTNNTSHLANTTAVVAAGPHLSLSPPPPPFLFVGPPAFFSRAKTASTIGSMIFFLCLFPYFAVEPNDTPAGSRRAACLLPPTCLALGTLAFAEFEDSGEVS